MAYYLDKERKNEVELGEQLGEGRFKIVYSGKGTFSKFAYAILKNEKNPKIAKLNTDKILRFVEKELPKEVYGPTRPIYDLKGEVAGFEMRKFKSGFIPFQLLATSNTWSAYELNLLKVAIILLNLCKVVFKLHSLNIIIGDFSTSNVEFNPKTLDVAFCDVDSYQIDELPCIAATVEFLSPRQYNKNLDEMESPFTKEDDHWSLAILMAQSLLRVHPFRKGNLDEDSVTNRILRGLHVLNPDLRYPPQRVANPLTALSDDFLKFLTMGFNSLGFKKAEEFLEVLQILATEESWKQCKDHGPYAKERTECPFCAADRSVPDFRQMVMGAGKIAFNEIYAGYGAEVLYVTNISDVIGSDLLLQIYRRGEILIAQKIDATGKVSSVTTLPILYEAGMEFQSNEKFLLCVAPNGEAAVIDLVKNLVVNEVKSLVYSKRPTIGLGKTSALWMEGKTLTKVQEVLGTKRPKSLLPISYGNVWVSASSYNSDKDIVVGFSNVLNVACNWFVWDNGTYKILTMLKVPEGHFMTGWNVYYSDAAFAVVRKVESYHAKKTYIDVFNHTTHLHHEEVMQSVEGKSILSFHENSFTLVIPTDKGLLRIKQGKETGILPGSEELPHGYLLASVLVNSKPTLFVSDNLTGKILTISR